MNEVEERLAAAEAVWAEGPRKFSAGGVNLGVGPLDQKYPYVSRRLCGTPAGNACKQVPITKGGVTMHAPLVESPKHERELASKFGLRRE